jgi:hypothetical protein
MPECIILLVIFILNSQYNLGEEYYLTAKEAMKAHFATFVQKIKMETLVILISEKGLFYANNVQALKTKLSKSF